MTKVIADKNCTGKTRELIKTSLTTGDPILALTTTKASSLREKSLAYFGEDVKVITLDEAKTYSGSILIDDLDEVISTLLQQVLNNSSVDVSTVVVNV